MPMIKRFPGQRTALLWSYWGRSRWLILGWTILMLGGGLTAGLSTEPVPIYLVLTIMLMFFPAAALADTRVQLLNARLPVSWQRLTGVELAATLGVVLWMALCSWAGFRIAGHDGSVPAILIFVPALAAGFVGLAISFSCESFGAAFYRGGLEADTGASSVELFSEEFWDSRRAPSDTYSTSLGKLPSLRGNSFLGENSIYRAGSPIGAQYAPLPASLPTNPFTSPMSAQVWYILNWLQEPDPDMGRMWPFPRWTILPFVAPLMGSICGSYLPGDPWPLAAAWGIGFFSWSLLLGKRRDQAFALQRPISDWNMTRVCMRLLQVALVLGVPIFWFLGTCFAWFNPDGAHPAFATLAGTFGVLAAALWTGWVSVALGPVVFFTAMLAAAYSVIGDPPVALLGVSLTLLVGWKFMPGVEPGPSWKHNGYSTAYIASAVALVCAHLLMQFSILSPLVSWTIREISGTLLVFTLLRHHIATGVMPADAGSRLTRALLGGAAALCVAVMLLGPTPEPQGGIAAICLVFGVVPSVFLPVVVMPRAIRWVRSLEGTDEQLQKEFPWLK